jgi:hypothetical protein
MFHILRQITVTKSCPLHKVGPTQTLILYVLSFIVQDIIYTAAVIVWTTFVVPVEQSKYVKKNSHF